MVILPVGHIQAVLKSKTISLPVRIALFEAIGELQRERLRHSRAAAFSWNGRPRGQFQQAKS